jgi:hypothetical protein
MPMSMSAADWTRMQRRKAGENYLTDRTREVAPPMINQLPYGDALLIHADVGGSKIRRTAGDYTNYVAAQVEDFVLTSQGSGGANQNVLNNNYRTQKVTRICSCSNSLGIVLPKTGVCTKCAITQHVRIN